jgi:hypothetical protein
MINVVWIIPLLLPVGEVVPGGRVVEVRPVLPVRNVISTAV